MQQKSIMDHSFGAVPISKIPRSVFNRSFTHTTSFDADYLIPIFLDQGILPGDTVSCRFNVLTRVLSPLIRPLMDNLYASIYTFFVPDRIIWSNFRKHMGEQDNPADSISFNIPTIPTPNGASGGIPVGHLYDYFGLPTEAQGIGGAGAASQSLANLAGRAYNKIYHDHFRDENLQNSPTIDTGDGPDTWANYNLLKIGKKFDYFTSCLPNPQKGATAVSLPLGTSATVLTSGTRLATGAHNSMTMAISTSGAYSGTTITAGIKSTTGDVSGISNTPTLNGDYYYPTNLYADLSTATAATINSLRQSITLQQFLERDARSGTRYVEIVKSHFAGVVIPDFRAQRSELIHVFNFDVKINPVASTADFSAPPQGVVGGLGGFGTGVSSGESYTHSFNEHGVLMSLMVIRGEIKYSQGISRWWRKSTRYDHYWPILSSLGEQAVLNEEIYSNLADGNASNQKSGVFGYIPRYDEYRHSSNILSGLMRPQVAGTLAIWNLAELFSAQPTLGNTFIQSNTPLDRAIAVPSEPHFMVDALFQVKHARVMPVYAVPGLTRL